MSSYFKKELVYLACSLFVLLILVICYYNFVNSKYNIFHCEKQYYYISQYDYNNYFDKIQNIIKEEGNIFQPNSQDIGNKQKMACFSSINANEKLKDIHFLNDSIYNKVCIEFLIKEYIDIEKYVEYKFDINRNTRLNEFLTELIYFAGKNSVYKSITLECLLTKQCQYNKLKKEILDFYKSNRNPNLNQGLQARGKRLIKKYQDVIIENSIN